jgi:MoaA/NifB/PqqE/SkfB family radical SAM enzyme
MRLTDRFVATANEGAAVAFRQVVLKARSENILLSALVELTHRCNLNCFYCYNDHEFAGTPMTAEEYFRFFEDLREMQVMNLVLSGGEPLAHADFMLLGKKARELGFVVKIKSNGHTLHRKMALRIKEEIAPFNIDVSLHGARAETHDRQTRVPGSFDRLMANLREMLSLGLRVNLNCTLTAWNESELEEMFALADGLGVRLQVNPEVTPRDNGDRDVLSILASREATRRLLRLQSARAMETRRRAGKKDRPADETIPVPSEKHCGAASSGITVDPYGHVYPCVQWRRSVGNLREKSIQEIWTRSAGIDEVRALTAEAREFIASLGDRGRRMGFCPALALLYTGSVSRLYPVAQRRMEIAAEMEKKEREPTDPTRIAGI